MQTLERWFREEKIFSCFEDLAKQGVTTPEELCELTEFDLSDILGWNLLTRRRVMNIIAKINGLSNPEPSLRSIVSKESLDMISNSRSNTPTSPGVHPVKKSSASASKFVEMRLCDLDSSSPKRNKKKVTSRYKQVEKKSVPRLDTRRFLRADVMIKDDREKHEKTEAVTARSKKPIRNAQLKPGNIKSFGKVKRRRSEITHRAYSRSSNKSSLRSGFDNEQLLTINFPNGKKCVRKSRKIIKLFEHNIPPSDTWRENKQFRTWKIISIPPEHPFLTITKGTCDIIKASAYDALAVKTPLPTPAQRKAPARPKRTIPGKRSRLSTQDDENVKENMGPIQQERPSSFRNSWRKKGLCRSTPASSKLNVRTKTKVIDNPDKSERVKYPAPKPESLQKATGIREKISRWRQWEADTDLDGQSLEPSFDSNIHKTQNRRRNKRITRMKSPARIAVERKTVPEDLEISSNDEVNFGGKANIPGWVTPVSHADASVRRGSARQTKDTNKHGWDIPDRDVYDEYIDIDGNVENFEDYGCTYEDFSISSLESVNTSPKKRKNSNSSGPGRTKRALSEQQQRWLLDEEEDENVESNRRWRSPAPKKNGSFSSIKQRRNWDSGVRSRSRYG